MTDKLHTELLDIAAKLEVLRSTSSNVIVNALFSSIESVLRQCPELLNTETADPRKLYTNASFRFLMDSTHAERSWSEDRHLENGWYSNSCFYCLREFSGYKRRAVCRVCSNVQQQLVSLTDDELSEICKDDRDTARRVIEAFCAKNRLLLPKEPVDPPKTGS